MVNLLAWAASAGAAHRRHAGLSPGIGRAVRWQLLLSAGYVAGCAYRSFVPVFDVPRLVLFDSWLSSVVVGRSVATVAELCFATQWALLLGAVSRATGSAAGLAVARAIPPLIVVAELCSWTAVLTTSNAGHVAEEAIWGLCAALLVCSVAIVWPRCQPSARPYLAGAALLGAAYVGYMFLVDVPMYWARWMAELDRGHRPVDIAQGFVDVSTRRIVSHRWDDWKSEVVWMSAYFSVAVWTSIALIHAPRLRGLLPAGQYSSGTIIEAGTGRRR